jgi:hypothetical protein
MKEIEKELKYIQQAHDCGDGDNYIVIYTDPMDMNTWKIARVQQGSGKVLDNIVLKNSDDEGHVESHITEKSVKMILSALRRKHGTKKIQLTGLTGPYSGYYMAMYFDNNKATVNVASFEVFPDKVRLIDTMFINTY